jgi:hypothetical protein
LPIFDVTTASCSSSGIRYVSPAFSWWNDRVSSTFDAVNSQPCLVPEVTVCHSPTEYHVTSPPVDCGSQGLSGLVVPAVFVVFARDAVVRDSADWFVVTQPLKLVTLARAASARRREQE